MLHDSQNLQGCHDGRCRPLTVTIGRTDNSGEAACVHRDGDELFIIELVDTALTGFPTFYNIGGHDDCICCDGFGALDASDEGVDSSFVGLFIPCDSQAEGTCEEEHTTFHSLYRITGRNIESDKDGIVTCIRASFYANSVPPGSSSQGRNREGDLVTISREEGESVSHVEWELAEPTELRIAVDIYAENLAYFLSLIHRTRVRLSAIEVRLYGDEQWLTVDAPGIGLRAQDPIPLNCALALSPELFLSALDRWSSFLADHQNLAEIIVLAGTSPDTGPIQELAICTALEGLHRILAGDSEPAYRVRVSDLFRMAKKVGFSFGRRNDHWLNAVKDMRTLHAHHVGPRRGWGERHAIGWSVWWLAWITVIREHLGVPDAVVAASIEADPEWRKLKRTIMRPKPPKRTGLQEIGNDFT